MLVDNRELIGTVSPTVYIDNIRVEEGKVSLSLIVKDSLNENLKSSFYFQKAKKYIHILYNMLYINILTVLLTQNSIKL